MFYLWCTYTNITNKCWFITKYGLILIVLSLVQELLLSWDVFVQPFFLKSSSHLRNKTAENRGYLGIQPDFAKLSPSSLLHRVHWLPDAKQLLSFVGGPNDSCQFGTIKKKTEVSASPPSLLVLTRSFTTSSAPWQPLLFNFEGEFFINPFSSHVQNNERSKGKFCTHLLSFVSYKSCHWCVGFICCERTGLHTSTNTEKKLWKQKLADGGGGWGVGGWQQSETKVGL